MIDWLSLSIGFLAGAVVMLLVCFCWALEAMFEEVVIDNSVDEHELKYEEREG